MFTHSPVLMQEVTDLMNLRGDGIYIDATFGRGGHSNELLKRLGAEGSLLAVDRDPEAVLAAAELERSDERFRIVQAAFSQIEEIATQDLFSRIF